MKGELFKSIWIKGFRFLFLNIFNIFSNKFGAKVSVYINNFVLSS